MGDAISRLDDFPVLRGADPDATDPLAVFRSTQLPRWALVRQQIDSTEVSDVSAAVEDALRPVRGLVRPADRVCLAVGSRGIDRIAQVTAATVRVLRDIGAKVFLVPAMGSHGGATASGQLEVLASLGITEQSVGCEIRSSMDTVAIGEVSSGIPVYLDRHAATEADMVIPINRVKPHTDFTGPTESGSLKMIAIGLGKQLGADTFHGQGFATFADLIPEVARFTLEHKNIPFGLALIENGHARLRRIEAVPANGMVEREQQLHVEADGLMARLPIDELDVLIIDQIGKDISGLGMDSNVVGRYYTGPTGSAPSIQRIVVRDLSDETEGNAVGIGMADVVLRRAVERMDAARTSMNCVTAKSPEGARIALTVDTDLQAIDVALACCLKVRASDARIAWIRDTKHIETFYASEPLLADLLASGHCHVVGAVGPIGFDTRGALTDPTPA